MIMKRTLITLLAGILAIQPALSCGSSTRLTTEATGMLAPTSPFATPVMQQIKGVVWRQMRLYQEEEQRQKQRQEKFTQKAGQFYRDFQNLETIWKCTLQQFKTSPAPPKTFVGELEHVLQKDQEINDPSIRIEQTHSLSHFAIICSGGFRIPFCIEEGRIFRTNLPYASAEECIAFYVTRLRPLIIKCIGKFLSLFLSLIEKFLSLLQEKTLVIVATLHFLIAMYSVRQSGPHTTLLWAFLSVIIIFPYIEAIIDEIGKETGDEIDTWSLSFRKDIDHSLLLKFIERNRIRRPLYENQDVSGSLSPPDLQFTKTLLHLENMVFKDVDTQHCLSSIKSIAEEIESAFLQARGYLPNEIRNQDLARKKQDLQLLAQLFARSAKLTINESSRAKRKGPTLASIVEERKGMCLETVYLFLAVSECLNLPVFSIRNSIFHISCLWDDGKDQYEIETTFLGKRTQSNAYDDFASQSICAMEKPFLYNDRKLFIEEYPLGEYTALYSKKQFMNIIACYYYIQSFQRLSMTDKERKAIFFDHMGIDKISSANLGQILPLIYYYEEYPLGDIPIELILGQVVSFINSFYGFPATHFLVARILQKAGNPAWLAHKNRAAQTTCSPSLFLYMGRDFGDSGLLQKGENFLINKTMYTHYAGYTYLYLGNHQKAAEALLRSYKNNPYDYDTNNILTISLVLLRESEQAKEIMDTWATISNSSDKGRFLRYGGFVYLLEGNYQEALNQFQGYLKHNSGEYSIRLHILLSLLLSKNGKDFSKELEQLYGDWSYWSYINETVLEKTTLTDILKTYNDFDLFDQDPSGLTREFMEIIIGQLKAENLEELEQRIIKLQKRVQHKPYLLKATKLLLLAQQPVTEIPYNLPTKASPRLDTLTQQPGMETLEQAA